MPYGFICWEVDCFYDTEVLGVLACQRFIRTEEQGEWNRVRRGEVMCAGDRGQGEGTYDVFRQIGPVKVQDSMMSRTPG